MWGDTNKICFYSLILSLYWPSYFPIWIFSMCVHLLNIDQKSVNGSYLLFVQYKSIIWTLPPPSPARACALMSLPAALLCISTILVAPWKACSGLISGVQHLVPQAVPLHAHSVQLGQPCHGLLRCVRECVYLGGLRCTFPGFVHWRGEYVPGIKQRRC